MEDIDLNELSESEILNMYNDIIEGPEVIMISKYNCQYDCRGNKCAC